MRPMIAAIGHGTAINYPLWATDLSAEWMPPEFGGAQRYISFKQVLVERKSALSSSKLVYNANLDVWGH